MQEYLKLERGWRSHPKMLELMAEIGPDADQYPVRLWDACLEHYHDGRIPTRWVEPACGWRGDPGKLLAALRKGYIDDVDETTVLVHGWTDDGRTGAALVRIVNRRTKTHQRVKELRAKKLAKADQKRDRGAVRTRNAGVRTSNAHVRTCNEDVRDGTLLYSAVQTNGDGDVVITTHSAEPSPADAGAGVSPQDKSPDQAPPGGKPSRVPVSEAEWGFYVAMREVVHRHAADIDLPDLIKAHEVIALHRLAKAPQGWDKLLDLVRWFWALPPGRYPRGMAPATPAQLNDRLDDLIAARAGRGGGGVAPPVPGGTGPCDADLAIIRATPLSEWRRAVDLCLEGPAPKTHEEHVARSLAARRKAAKRWGLSMDPPPEYDTAGGLPWKGA